jgi:hypothetical protein
MPKRLSKAADNLSADRLRSLLSYDPLTGIFRWLVARRNWVTPGEQAGYTALNGYVSLQLCGTRYAAHRLAWLYMTGEWPRGQLDHVNANRSDNRWGNLREADGSQNQANRRRAINNTSGFKGVSQRVDDAKWVAQIKVRGRSIYLGRYETPREAHDAYRTAAVEHWGAFARVA